MENESNRGNTVKYEYKSKCEHLYTYEYKHKCACASGVCAESIFGTSILTNAWDIEEIIVEVECRHSYTATQSNYLQYLVCRTHPPAPFSGKPPSQNNLTYKSKKAKHMDSLRSPE